MGLTLNYFGEVIFVSNRDGDDEIYSINIDGTSVTNITNNTVIDNDPSWSPDGTKIAFRSEQMGSAIYVMNADGTNVKRLSPTPGKDSTPSWSPDGKRIAFSSSRDGQPDIYTMNVDGTDTKRLTFNAGNPNRVAECNALGENTTQECKVAIMFGFDPRAIDYAPAWSPDGTKIAFWSQRDGDQEIFIMNSDGSGQKQLTFNSVPDGEMAFFPDGQKIIFARGVNGVGQIFTMNVDGSNQTQITSFSKGEAAGDMSLSPDGAKMVFQRSSGEGTAAWTAEVWIMNIDGSNQKGTGQKCNPAYCTPRWQPGKKSLGR